MIELTAEMIQAAQAAACGSESDECMSAAITAALTLFVKLVEGTRGSGLCDCDDTDGDPTNPKTGAIMDHHCDCAAVTTAAKLLGAYSETVHAEQCDHDTSTDQFYERRSPTTTYESGGDVR